MNSKSTTTLSTLIHFTKVLKKMMLSYYKMIKIHLTSCHLVQKMAKINAKGDDIILLQNDKDTSYNEENASNLYHCFLHLKNK